MRITITRLVVLFLLALMFVASCARRERLVTIADLEDKIFGVPYGTATDRLVMSVFPEAAFVYYNHLMDAIHELITGNIDVVAYDFSIIQYIAARESRVRILDELIVSDEIGLAVQLDNVALKRKVNDVITILTETGMYDDMVARWFPERGLRGNMPEFTLNPKNGILRFGTAAVVEPFSFFDSAGNIIGFDIELAHCIAMHLDMGLEIINTSFESLIPSLQADHFDLIGASISITEERAQQVLFSAQYFRGGIAALIRR